MRVASAVLVATLIVGQTGFPVGVSSPVLNRIKFVPPLAIAVVLSKSLPGVH